MPSGAPALEGSDGLTVENSHNLKARDLTTKEMGQIPVQQLAGGLKGRRECILLGFYKEKNLLFTTDPIRQGRLASPRGSAS